MKFLTGLSWAEEDQAIFASVISFTLASATFTEQMEMAAVTVMVRMPSTNETHHKQGIDLIKFYEGYSARIYICAGGYHSIGYGHLIRLDEKDKFKAGIDEAAALQILAQDARAAERAVIALINVPLSDNQFSAVTSFTYNLGSGALQRSGLRQRINRAEHDAVPSELMKWVFAGGRRLKGLVARRAAESRLYMQ